MANVVLYTFMGLEALFVVGGILLLVIAVVTRAALNSNQTTDNVANNLLLSQGPLTGNCDQNLPFPPPFIHSIR
jgi:hypothetical protein